MHLKLSQPVRQTCLNYMEASLQEGILDKKKGGVYFKKGFI